MNFKSLSDEELVMGFRETVMDEQLWLASHLAYLAELDRRKLFYHYASLRAFLVAEFGIDTSVAERRIRAARLLRRFPFLEKKLERGKLTITHLEIAQACAHREKLSDEELAQVLESISGLSCEGARREIVARYPVSGDELPSDRVRPLTDELSEVRFVATEELLEKLDEIRGWLAHSHSKLRLGELIDHLADDYRERHHPEAKARRAQKREEKRQEKKQPEKKTETLKTPAAPLLYQKAQEPERPLAEKRFFSQAIAHALTLRDGYQCRYIDPTTKRTCQSTFDLQIDHVQAWAHGGKTELANARYLCAPHHRRVSFLQFGGSSRYFRR